jgi:hypothetical protein
MPTFQQNYFPENHAIEPPIKIFDKPKKGFLLSSRSKNHFEGKDRALSGKNYHSFCSDQFFG